MNFKLLDALTIKRRWFSIAFGIFVSILIVWWWGGARDFGYTWWRFRGRWYFEQFRAERLVRTDSSKSENWSRLGCARYWTGDEVGSLDAYHHAWQLDSNNLDLTYAVAFGMQGVGHNADAELWFSNIITMCEQRGHPEWETNALENLRIIQKQRLQFDHTGLKHTPFHAP
jgi:hypothetical protein